MLRHFWKIYLCKLEYTFPLGSVAISGSYGYGSKCPLQQIKVQRSLEYYRKYIPECDGTTNPTRRERQNLTLSNAISRRLWNIYFYKILGLYRSHVG
jgi:hypothetical protein